MIRVAFVGKGGAGKSTICGTFARLLARRGEPVLAVDSDPVPGMPYALGVPVDDAPIPDDVVVDGPGDGVRWVLAAHVDADLVIDRYAVVCPDGVRYLQFGNLWGNASAIQRAQHAWSQVIAEVDPESWHLVGDLPGGTRQAMTGWARYAETVCVVVEPTTKSLHTARRLLNLGDAAWAPLHLVLVANKVRSPDDVRRIEDRLERGVSAVVPLDPDVLRGEREGYAPLDVAPDGDLVGGVRDLMDHVMRLNYSSPLEGSR